MPLVNSQPDSPPPQSRNTERKGFGLTAWALFAVFSFVFTHLFAAAMRYSLGSIIIYGLYPVMLLGLFLAYLLSFLAARAFCSPSRPSTGRCVSLSLLLSLGTAVVAFAGYSIFWPHSRYIGP